MLTLTCTDINIDIFWEGGSYDVSIFLMPHELLFVLVVVGVDVVVVSILFLDSTRNNFHPEAQEHSF